MSAGGEVGRAGLGVMEGWLVGVRDGWRVEVMVGEAGNVAVGEGLNTATGIPAQETATMRMNIIAKMRRMDIL